MTAQVPGNHTRHFQFHKPQNLITGLWHPREVAITRPRCGDGTPTGVALAGQVWEDHRRPESIKWTACTALLRICSYLIHTGLSEVKWSRDDGQLMVYRHQLWRRGLPCASASTKGFRDPHPTNLGSNKKWPHLVPSIHL